MFCKNLRNKGILKRQPVVRSYPKRSRKCCIRVQIKDFLSNVLSMLLYKAHIFDIIWACVKNTLCCIDQKKCRHLTCHKKIMFRKFLCKQLPLLFFCRPEIFLNFCSIIKIGICAVKNNVQFQFFPFETTMMPAHTSTREIKVTAPVWFDSCKNIAERRTPKTGFKKPNTTTFETGLYFSKSPQME